MSTEERPIISFAASRLQWYPEEGIHIGTLHRALVISAYIAYLQATELTLPASRSLFVWIRLWGASEAARAPSKDPRRFVII